MKICSLSSGSSGNSVYVETEKSKILVDVGFSGRQIEFLLNKIGRKTRDIDMIFVTHEHIDHVKGVGVISRKYDIPIYATEGTWIGMRNKIGLIRPRNIHLLRANKPENIRDFDLLPFAIYHDARDPIGFIIMQKDQKITIMTDTGCINDRIISTIKNSNVYYIEANHDIDMLANGPYTEKLKKRIASKFGHLSNIDSARVLSEILKGERERILLAHLSKENNLPEVALFTVENMLLEDGLDTSRDIGLEVAPRFEPSSFINLDKNI